MKQYKDQETFTANNVSYVKVQIMLAEKITFKRQNISVNYEAVKFINLSVTTNRNGTIKYIILKLDLRIGEPMQICIHRKDNSPKPVNHHLTLKEGPKVKSNNIRRFPADDFL